MHNIVQNLINIENEIKKSNINTNIIYCLLTKSLSARQIKAAARKIYAYDFMIILCSLKQEFITTIKFVKRPLLSINWSRLYEKAWQLPKHNTTVSLDLLGRFLTVQDVQSLIIAVEASTSTHASKREQNSTSNKNFRQVRKRMRMS